VVLIHLSEEKEDVPLILPNKCDRIAPSACVAKVNVLSLLES
jgi:hypothetical protein